MILFKHFWTYTAFLHPIQTSLFIGIVIEDPIIEEYPFIQFLKIQINLTSWLYHFWGRDTKSQNFPVGKISRAKTFRTECVNRFATYMRQKCVDRFRDIHAKMP